MTSNESKRGTMALVGAAVGFVVGMMLVWQGCAHGESMTSQETTIAAFGGVLFAILGAVVGAQIRRS